MYEGRLLTWRPDRLWRTWTALGPYDRQVGKLLDILQARAAGNPRMFPDYRPFQPYTIVDTRLLCNEYIDLRMGYGPVILGHGDERVDDHVNFRMRRGVSFSLTSEDEVEAKRAPHPALPST